MKNEFNIKLQSRGDWLFYQFTPATNLTGCLGVVFKMRNRLTKVVKIAAGVAQVAIGTYTIDGVVRTLTAADGVVFFPWPQNTDLDTAGDYEFEFHATMPQGLLVRPGEGWTPLTIGATIT